MIPTESSRFRFVVRSAEEAVTVLREKLGPRARVVSVKQVQGKGLARFLSAPSLEVIAEVTPEIAAPAQEKPEPVAEPVSKTPAQEPEPHPAPTLFPTAESALASLLRAGGLSGSIIARMQGAADWKRWEQLPPAEALTHVAHVLRETWRKRAPKPLGQRVAFVGSPGAGKTTALCKQLAADVLVRRRKAVVLKMDLENANPDDGLVVFCTALGVPFAREVAELPELGPADVLYIDVPGVTPRDVSQTTQLRDVLDAVAADSRVLVLNAAYDSDILKNSWVWGADLACSHTAFTHLDELTHWAKLWDLVLPPALQPLFLSTGQSIAGDMEENVFDAVLARTFPAPVNPLQAAA
jgi:flagellar biosynthesis protein FlhF